MLSEITDLLDLKVSIIQLVILNNTIVSNKSFTASHFLFPERKITLSRLFVMHSHISFVFLDTQFEFLVLKSA